MGRGGTAKEAVFLMKALSELLDFPFGVARRFGKVSVTGSMGVSLGFTGVGGSLGASSAKLKVILPKELMALVVSVDRVSVVSDALWAQGSESV